MVGLRVHNSLGYAVGSLALRYSRAEFDADVRAMGLRITALCAGVLVVFASLGAGLTLFFTRGLRRRLHAMWAAIEAPSEERVASAPDASAAHFAETVEEAQRAVKDAEQQIRSIEAESGALGPAPGSSP